MSAQDPPTYAMAAQDQDPPTYEQVTGCQPNEQFTGSGRCTLVLDGCKIYPAEPPSRILYELSSAPCDAIADVYGVQKVRYRLSDAGGEGRVRYRLDHIYDFKNKTFFSLRDLRQPVVLEGKTSRKRSYKEVIMAGGMTGWTTCAAEGHFKAEVPISERFRSDNQILWKNPDGVIVASETRVRRKDDGSLDGMPRLDIREIMGEKDQDLLIACWVARLWRESKSNQKELLTRNDREFFWPCIAFAEDGCDANAVGK